MSARAYALVLRLFLGGLILATGAGKALDIPGFAGVLAAYRPGLPGGALLPIAGGIAVLELMLGAWLLGGWQVVRAARVAMALNAIYFIVLEITQWRGLEIENCGCFGVFLAQPLRWYTPLEDLVLIGLFYLLMRVART